MQAIDASILNQLGCLHVAYKPPIVWIRSV